MCTATCELQVVAPGDSLEGLEKLAWQRPYSTLSSAHHRLVLCNGASQQRRVRSRRFQSHGGFLWLETSRRTDPPLLRLLA